MAPFITTAESNSDTADELKHRNKRRTLVLETETDHPRNRRRWSSQTEQQIYSSKLVEALRRNNSPAANGREVRETADRVLAVSAKGSTRWSRAILSRRVKLLRVRKVKAAAGLRRRSREQDRASPVEKKLRVLSRLVPGCKSAPLVNLLEEASDYIAALEMQVKAMAALTQILGGGGRLHL